MSKSEPLAQVKAKPNNSFQLIIKGVDLGIFPKSEMQHLVQIIDNKIF